MVYQISIPFMRQYYNKEKMTNLRVYKVNTFHIEGTQYFFIIILIIMALN